VRALPRYLVQERTAAAPEPVAATDASAAADVAFRTHSPRGVPRVRSAR
jgi:hypothetical protein